MQIRKHLIDDRDADLLCRLMREHPELTETELRIRALAERGLTSREIADLFHCSIRTIENHRYRMGKKKKSKVR